MRKLAAILLLLALLLSVAACAQGETVLVGLCMRGENEGVNADSADHIKAALASAGYRVQLHEAGNDQARQLRQVEELIGQGVSLLVVEPVMVAAAQEVVELAKNADVPLVFIHHEPGSEVLESWERVCYVGADLSQPGAMQGQLLLQTPDKGDLNGDGIVSCLLVNGPEDHMDTPLRTADWNRALEAAGLEVNCIKTCHGDWTRQSGMDCVKQALAEYGKDIEVIFCGNDAMAAGALEAIKDGGRTVGENVYLTGIDGERHALVLIRSGEMTGTVALDLELLGQKVAQTATAFLRKKSVEKRSYLAYVAVTGENIQEFMGE